MPESGVPAATETRSERTESARLDNFVDGAFAGFSYALLGFTGGIANRYRARVEQGIAP